LNAATSEKGTVAIVDDDRHLCSALTSLLRASTFTVLVFSTAEAFLQFSNRGGLSCLILDYQLPGMTGIELQKCLVAEGYRVPIIFISARDDAAVREVALQRGAAAFLTKPLTGQSLLREIDAVLANPISGSE
jgi:FixJ family two-component response regulator